MPIHKRGSPTSGFILAFAERLELAKSRRQRAPSFMTGLHPKADMKIPMSAFSLFTSGVGGKAAVVSDRRLRPLLTHSGHRLDFLYVCSDVYK
jgi:hypothetical protein